MNPLIKKFAKLGRNYSRRVDTEGGRLGSMPNFIIGFSVFMSANAIIQAVLDILLELAILTELVSFKLPFRIEFLFLTLLSALIAYLTFEAMREGDVDVTRNTMIIGVVVELALVTSDVFLIIGGEYDLLTVLLTRVPFLIFTSFNIAILTYILYMRYTIKRARPNNQF